jgi:pimeloyl-ACP methyl ester carboxylesterase
LTILASIGGFVVRLYASEYPDEVVGLVLVDSTHPNQWMDIRTSAAQVRAAGNFGDKPLVVLSHSPDWRMAPDLPDGVSRKLEQVSQDLQNEFVHLSSKSIHKSAAKAGHLIQAEDPQLVIEAILKVVDATQK